jgi:hypothetical protein
MALDSRIIVAAFVGVLLCMPAQAQTPEPEVPAQPEAPTLDPRACTDRDRLKQGDTVETDGHAPQAEEPLSDKLARTDGVICPPPGLDPHIRAPAPDTGSGMPVIPPPAGLAEPQTRRNDG